MNKIKMFYKILLIRFITNLTTSHLYINEILHYCVLMEYNKIKHSYDIPKTVFLKWFRENTTMKIQLFDLYIFEDIYEVVDLLVVLLVEVVVSIK